MAHDPKARPTAIGAGIPVAVSYRVMMFSVPVGRAIGRNTRGSIYPSSMWLKYGLNADNILVSIEETPRGKTGLRCPYCSGELTAKKGKIKVHHFAHTGTTCQPVLRRSIPTLPLYDNFFVRLSAQELYQLGQLWQQYGRENRPIPHAPFRFVLSKLLIRQGEGYEFAPLGKIPLGALPLREFNEVQEPLLASELRRLAGRAERAQRLELDDAKECLADLELYRAQLRRILQLKLYFLHIRADGKNLHKIGVTRRDMGERLPEIERDLRSHFSRVAIEVLGTWEGRGNVELYFKHCYQAFNYRIGSLTEYFEFDEVEAVYQNLCQMESTPETAEALDVLRGASFFSGAIAPSQSLGSDTKFSTWL